MTTREQWLQLAIDLLRPGVESVGLELPPTVHVSVGFPSTRALSANRRRVGECWSAKASKDGNPHVFISPLLDDSVDVLACLLHELIHAAGIEGHKASFKRPAEQLGLEGKMTATVPGEGLKSMLEELVNDVLGEYPHAKLENISRPTKKQTTRLLKAVCCIEECGMVIRVTSKYVSEPGLPICQCGGVFELAS